MLAVGMRKKTKNKKLYKCRRGRVKRTCFLNYYDYCSVYDEPGREREKNKKICGRDALNYLTNSEREFEYGKLQ